MAESEPPHSFSHERILLQTKKKLISASGNSIKIHNRNDVKRTREIQIFPKSTIRFLLPIEEESGEKEFFLAISPKRIALFNLKKSFPIVIFKVEEKIVDHGLVKALAIGRKNDEEEADFRVRLIIPLVFRSGTVKNIQLTVIFFGSKIIKQKLKCLEELRMDEEGLKMCVLLGPNFFFGLYEDTVVKSDGTVTRVGEPSVKKKRRIAAVGRDLWNGNLLLATENGSIRAVRVKDEGKKEKVSLSMISEGQCVPPLCALRFRQPSVIISTKNIVIVGTERGEVHCLNERLELIRKYEMKGGPISCLKVDDSNSDHLWVGFESGELKRMNIMFSEQNDASADDTVMNSASLNDENDNDKSDCEWDPPMKKSRDSVTPSLVCKRSETEIICLEEGCHFTTFVAQTFVTHLRMTHRTSLALAGLVLLCQCGNESISWRHSKLCNISNFTVFRKPDFGPIRTFADKMTPQCTLCKAYPKTVCGYAKHLYEKHRKTLHEIGSYLQCGVCGGDFYIIKRCYAHSTKCKSRFFKLLKLNEEKDETEMDQNTDENTTLVVMSDE